MRIQQNSERDCACSLALSTEVHILDKPSASDRCTRGRSGAFSLRDRPWVASGNEGEKETFMSLKIMIVDDEPVSLKLMRSLAAPLGHTVLAFEDSQEAGQRAEKQRFDVAFVGMRTPQPDGLELARRIRNSEPNRETTIVMLSATDDVESLRRAFGEGADFVLTKPVGAGSLRPMLAAMDSLGWKGKRHAARLPFLTEVICTWDDRQFPLRSLNISESGMLLQPSVNVDVGQEVALEFKIAEARASLNVVARIVRKEGAERVGMEFVGLAPEDHNAIQLYVMGHLKDLTPPRDLSDIRMRRFFSP
jgi:CheY-like chemotaxis protein